MPALAVSVTDSAFPTVDTVAENTVLVALAGTVTVAGTVTAALLLDRFTVRPPDGAAVLSVTVQTSVPEPDMEAPVQATALKVAVAAPPGSVPDEPSAVPVFSA